LNDLTFNIETQSGIYQTLAGDCYHMSKREWDTTIWKANNVNILRVGLKPEFTFEQGFRQTVDWFQNHPELFEHYLGK